MYRVAILVNENETLHSVYANAENIINESLSIIYKDRVNEFYSFEVFDKFNIFELFNGKSDNNIWTFDSIFISTNACNNKEIYDELTANKNIISSYIDDEKGNQHGIFVSNQQKLGGLYEDAKSIEFLPSKFSYRLIKRKEKKSSDGNVKMNLETDLLTSFPLNINDNIIKNACSGKFNQFMPHKYRFYIEPKYDSSYKTIYYDDTYSDTDSIDHRPLLLKSRIGNERVVISSMVLDWAEHLHQLANIIVFITEGVDQFAFITKTNVEDPTFSRYIKKARDYQIAVKEYDEISIIHELEKIKNQERIHNSNINYLPHKRFVFSTTWDKNEVNILWNTFVISSNCNVSFYRLILDDSNKIVLESLFTKFIQNSQMFLSAEEWLTANFILSKWRKSIWTYEYILSFYNYLGFDKTSYIVPLLKEIESHYKINNHETDTLKQITNINFDNYELFKGMLFQSYDNVFNSTCSCCNVLAKLYSICKRNNITELKFGDQTIHRDYILNEKIKFGNWIISKINSKDYRSRISWQDYLMAFVSIYESEYIVYLKKEKSKIYELLCKQIISALSLLEKEVFDIRNGFKVVREKITNPDLCKAIKFLYVLCILNKSYQSYVEGILINIENCLLYRQKYNGQWKNLSETSEVVLALVYKKEINLSIKNSKSFEKVTSRAINYIVNEFDYEKSCWLGDENTTAKSLNAILLYDEIFNLAFDDFLLDLVNNTNKYSHAVNVTNNIKALDYAQEQNNKLKIIIKKKQLEIESNKIDKRYSKRLIKNYKFLVSLLASSFALSFLFILCIFGILASSYYETLKEIVAENIAIIISTSLGIVVTAILTGIAQHAKTKLLEEYERKDDNK